MIRRKLKLSKASWCCYLVRPICAEEPQHGISPYVGISRKPDKRWAQHSGDEDGGAVFTTKHGVRWTPVCVATGFLNDKESALIFESQMHKLMKEMPWFRRTTSRISKLFATHVTKQEALTLHWFAPEYVLGPSTGNVLYH